MSLPQVLTRGLPRGVRRAAVVCLLLAAVTELMALHETVVLMYLQEVREEQAPSHLSEPEQQVFVKVMPAQLSALEPMRESRSLVLGALAVACMFVFVSAARLLWPAGLSREAVRQTLGGALLGAAVLRTLDGAQLAVVARRVGPAVAEAMSQLPEFQDPAVAQQLAGTLPTLYLVVVAGHTALMAGAFLVLGQYFRSQKVREAVSAQDHLAE